MIPASREACGDTRGLISGTRAAEGIFAFDWEGSGNVDGKTRCVSKQSLLTYVLNVRMYPLQASARLCSNATL